MTRIVCISDTHLRHSISIPDGNMLLHAGDATFRGTEEEVSEFARWYSSFPHAVKVFVAGNHDWGFEKRPEHFREILEDKGIIYLQDQSATLFGLNVYGSPWQPTFFDWAFNLDRGDDIKEKWDQIPDSTDVLITHGPPKGILDRTLAREMRPPQSVGCWDLKERVTKLSNLKLHVFGHIHPGYGIEKQGGVTFVNASICNEDYKPVNAPIVIDL